MKEADNIILQNTPVSIPDWILTENQEFARFVCHFSIFNRTPHEGSKSLIP